MAIDHLSLQAWGDAWHAIGAGAADGDIHRQLLTRYAEPQRHYHTAQHLAECFERLHDAPHEAERLGEVSVDVDLSVLGAPAARFDEYERQVREEYRWVPGILFRRTRRKILEQFLERPRIYQTSHFFEAYQETARANLTRSLGALSA